LDARRPHARDQEGEEELVCRLAQAGRDGSWRAWDRDGNELLVKSGVDGLGIYAARGTRWATALCAIRRERTVSSMSRVSARCSARATIITASASAWRREKYGRDHHNKAAIYGLMFTAAADLLQRQLPAFVVQLFETVKAVPAVPRHLAGLAHIAELLGQLQQPYLRPNDLLLLRRVVISAPPKGGWRSPAPPAPFGNQQRLSD
jgi:hypothetical protein